MKNGILFTLVSIVLIIYFIGFNKIMITLGYEKSKSDVQHENVLMHSVVVFTDYKILNDSILLKSRICKKNNRFTIPTEVFTNINDNFLIYTINDSNDFILSELAIHLQKFKSVENNCLSYNGTLKLPIKNTEIIKIVHSIKATNITRYGKVIDMLDNKEFKTEMIVNGEIFILDDLEDEIVEHNNINASDKLLKDFDNFILENHNK